MRFEFFYLYSLVTASYLKYQVHHKFSHGFTIQSIVKKICSFSCNGSHSKCKGFRDQYDLHFGRDKLKKIFTIRSWFGDANDIMHYNSVNIIINYPAFNEKEVQFQNKSLVPLLPTNKVFFVSSATFLI